MLSDAKLPKSFWAEAMCTIVDLINLSLLVPLDGNVTERVYTRKDVSYKHLRVFGCRAYVHIPKDERSKFDDKAKECIFLGYGHKEFGYRLWNPLARKLIISRDVVFLKDQIVSDAEKSDKSQSSPEIPIFPTSVSSLIAHNDMGELERIIVMVQQNQLTRHL